VSGLNPGGLHKPVANEFARNPDQIQDSVEAEQLTEDRQDWHGAG